MGITMLLRLRDARTRSCRFSTFLLDLPAAPEVQESHGCSLHNKGGVRMIVVPSRGLFVISVACLVHGWISRRCRPVIEACFGSPCSPSQNDLSSREEMLGYPHENGLVSYLWHGWNGWHSPGPVDRSSVAVSTWSVLWRGGARKAFFLLGLFHVAFRFFRPHAFVSLLSLVYFDSPVSLDYLLCLSFSLLRLFFLHAFISFHLICPSSVSFVLFFLLFFSLVFSLCRFSLFSYLLAPFFFSLRLFFSFSGNSTYIVFSHFTLQVLVFG